MIFHIALLVIVQSEPIAWIFGYGSIVNTHADRGKFVTVTLNYERTWNSQNDKGKATFLGLRSLPLTESKQFSGIIFPIDSQKELDDLDFREQGYHRKAISRDHLQILHEGLNEEIQNRSAKTGEDIFVYIPDEGGQEPDAMYPILQSYVYLVVKGFLIWEDAIKSGDIIQNFFESTSGWSKFYLNDIPMARRPWIHEERHYEIDTALQKYVRIWPKYPEEYTALFYDEILYSSFCYELYESGILTLAEIREKCRFRKTDAGMFWGRTLITIIVFGVMLGSYFWLQKNKKRHSKKNSDYAQCSNLTPDDSKFSL